MRTIGLAERRGGAEFETKLRPVFRTITVDNDFGKTHVVFGENPDHNLVLQFCKSYSIPCKCVKHFVEGNDSSELCFDNDFLVRRAWRERAEWIANEHKTPMPRYLSPMELLDTQDPIVVKGHYEVGDHGGKNKFLTGP